MQSLVPESDRTHEFFVVHEIGMDGEPNRRPAVVVMIKAAEPFDEARNERFLGRSVKKRFVPSEFRGKVRTPLPVLLAVPACS